jgi:Rne/Rng family ribonuclease
VREILINVEPYEKRVAITYKGVLEEFSIERTDQPRLAGNIYKGIIESVVPGIGALFVNIGTGKNGFLYRDEREKNLKKGQTVLVQVVKEPIGTKGPLLTTDISLPGKYLVLMPFSKTLGISKRIEDARQRATLKGVLEKLRLPGGVGCIARTESLAASPRQLALEVRYLMKLWSRIRYRAEKEKPPTLAYEEYDLPLRIIRDHLYEDVGRILVDSREEYKKISRFANYIQPKLRRKLFYYRGKTPLYEKHGIEERIEEIFRRKIFLKSGGSIVIEKTESLIAVDVNTGRFTGKRDPEETAFKTNMEAAREIARQVMLRDIGGIIVIDFIDMGKKAYRREVTNALASAFERDKAKIKILAISGIGLVEMTRQRIRKSLESVSFRECPYCTGMGRVKTPATIAIGAVRRLERRIWAARGREVALRAHPDVAGYLGDSFRNVLRTLEKKSRKKITVKTDSKLHVEDVYFE